MNWLRRCFAIGGLFVLNVHAHSVAQTVNNTQYDVDSNSNQDADQVDQYSDLESRLDQLIETTGRVRQQLLPPISQALPADWYSGDASSASELPAPSVFQITPSPRQEPTGSEKDIRERLKLLRRLRTQSVADDTKPLTNRATLESHSTVSGTGVKRREMEPSLVAIEESIDSDEQTITAPPTPIPAPIEATEVVSSPVNALALAQSLYRTKNYSAALKALSSADAPSLTDSDRTWIELLSALCQRRLGQTDAAEARLREIANANSTDYPVPVARWWLKQTEMVRDTRPILSEISAELDLLIERSKRHVQH